MSTLGQSLWEILRFAVVVYLILIVAIFLWQDKILFYPRPVSLSAQKAINNNAVEIKNGAHTLRGWLVENPSADNHSYVIYFGGNAEELSESIMDIGRLAVSGILLVNYRGYGDSDGKPSAKGLQEDALVVFDWLIGQREILPNHIVLMGRSLGAGVATWVASQREIAGVILISPFDSLAEVGQRHYPWLPVKLLLRHRMNSVDLAPDISVPLLTVIGTRDRVIPNEHSLRLTKAWGGPTQVVTLEGADHNSLSLFPKYWQAINNWMNHR